MCYLSPSEPSQCMRDRHSAFFVAVSAILLNILYISLRVVTLQVKQASYMHKSLLWLRALQKYADLRFFMLGTLFLHPLFSEIQSSLRSPTPSKSRACHYHEENSSSGVVRIHRASQSPLWRSFDVEPWISWIILVTAKYYTSQKCRFLVWLVQPVQRTSSVLSGEPLNNWYRVAAPDLRRKYHQKRDHGYLNPDCRRVSMTTNSTWVSQLF
jgi:hypothetical protein